MNDPLDIRFDDGGFRLSQRFRMPVGPNGAQSCQATVSRPRLKVSALILVAFLALLSANATPHSAPTASRAQAVTRQVLTLVNEARAKRRRCGWKRFDAAAPLVLSDVLQQAALAHARDMAERKILSHGGRDGSTPGERATRSGYRWRVVGENIAAGQSTAEQVVAEWLGSPRHCANLMSADYSEMGIAYAVNPQSTLGIYWAQLFAAPRPAP